MPDTTSLIDPLVNGALNLKDLLMTEGNGFVSFYMLILLGFIGVSILIGIVSRPPGSS